MDKTNPLVSVIVITYNSEKTVIETLESIKFQSYNNIELIISDDNSSDNTIGICKEWLLYNEKSFKNTKLITSSINTGIAPNLNRGCRQSNGKWIKPIAGDDILKEYCIENNVEYTTINIDIQILFSNVFEFEVINGEKIETKTKKLGDKRGYKLNAYEQYKKLLTEYFGDSPTCFILKKTIEDVGFFDERFPYIEDYPMWLKITKNGIKLNYMPKTTVLYRHGDSITSSKTNAKFTNILFHNSRKKHYYTEVKPNIKKLNIKHNSFTYKYNIFVIEVALNIFKNKKNAFSKIIIMILYYLNPQNLYLKLKTYKK